jgi:hypothetical protein
MITTTKNNSFICAEEICDRQIIGCLKCNAPVEQEVHPVKKYLRALWLNIRLFLETDKWDHNITLKIGDSHYTMKMEDIESRWRNQ